MAAWLREYDTGQWFGPASEERVKQYEEAQKRGNAYFSYPYCGFELRMTVGDNPVSFSRPRIASKSRFEEAQAQVVKAYAETFSRLS